MTASPLLFTLLASLLAFLLVLALAIAFGGFDNSKKPLLRRIEKLKDRHIPDRALVARARSLRIRPDEHTGMFGGLMKGLVPRPAELRKRLAATGRSISVSQYSTTSLMTILISFLAAKFLLGLPPITAVLIGLALGVGLPHFVVSRMINKRIQTFIKQFPDAIDLVVRGLRAGLPVAQSIAGVGAEFSDPVGSEFRAVTDKVKFGKTLEAALWETAERIPAPDFKFFVITLAIQRETGGNLAETLDNLSDILRKRQQLKLKIKAMSSEAKASAYIVGALPFIMFGMMLMLNYSYAATMFTDPRAMMAGIGGLIWMGIGVAIMAKMISFEI